MTTVLWWLRRDLRLSDNQALDAALSMGGLVIPVFILDERLLASPYAGEKRLNFLFSALQNLDTELRQCGSRLVVRRGRPEIALAELMRASGASKIFAEPDYSPFAARRDTQVAACLPVAWAGSPVMQPPDTILKPNGQPYTVFTAFNRAWQARPRPAPRLAKPFPGRPERLPAVPDALFSEPLPAVDAGELFPATEAEAQRRLQGFTTGEDALIYTYGEERNRIDHEGTSGLSPYLRFGLLSARQAVAAAWAAIEQAPSPPARQNAEAFYNELAWREFYVYILHHYPQVRQGNFRLKEIFWKNDPAQFAAWCAGQTGYPLVDAAMRQLNTQGWMHNRARMLVASFLAKDLLIDWRWGERWFMQHLIDGDPAANNGGWQWTAGTGTDAAPYFRIFNPVSQSIRHDPAGRFIRRWLPELAGVPDEYIHEPWKMPDEAQQRSGCRIGQDYPAPMVDHAWARERALAVYGQA